MKDSSSAEQALHPRQAAYEPEYFNVKPLTIIS